MLPTIISHNFREHERAYAFSHNYIGLIYKMLYFIITHIREQKS